MRSEWNEEPRIEAQGCAERLEIQKVETLSAAFEFAERQLRRLFESHPGYFPLYTKNGKWFHEGEHWTRWGDGFVAGMAWILAKRTRDPYWLERAKTYSAEIEPRKRDERSQSHGSLFLPTYGYWHDWTGEAEPFRVVEEAARTYMKRFNQKGGYIASFVDPASSLIDNLMTARILFYVGSKLGDEGMLDVARRHCLTTRRYHLRGDGSSAHECLFDLETGAFLRHETHQGWRADSSWARGQAWVIYGYTYAFDFMPDPRFLDAAKRAADFYMERTDARGVPPNDWEEPEPRLPYESSAAAAAAYGMLQLGRQLGATGEPYRDYAIGIVDTLCSREFLAVDDDGWEGVLKHAIYHERKGIGVDESVVWGDYFFVQVLDALLP